MEPWPRYLEARRQELRTKAPMWETAVWKLNAADYGLPQSRRRIYLVGVNAHLGLQLPPPPRVWKTCTSITDVMHPGIPPLMHLHHRPRAENLVANLREYRTLLEWGKLAAIELDRSPKAGMGPWMRQDEHCTCLRTCNEHIWLERLPDISRQLHPLERFSLQGFPPIIGAHLSKKEVLRHTGNAFAVPCVGAVLAQLHNATADQCE